MNRTFLGRPAEDWAGWGFACFIVTFFIVAILAMAGVARAEVDVESLLDTIALAESSNNPDAVGDKGRARGLCQVQRDVWYKFAGDAEPWGKAFDPVLNRDVARLRIFDILQRHGFTDPARAAWLYNCGEPCGLSFREWMKRQPNDAYRTLYER